jgi:hypothetical protein
MDEIDHLVNEELQKNQAQDDIYEGGEDESQMNMRAQYDELENEN